MPIRITPPIVSGPKVIMGCDQLPPRTLRQTHTYATLEIAAKSFEDIKWRLIKSCVLDDYLLTDDEHGEVLVFGGVGFIREKA